MDELKALRDKLWAFWKGYRRNAGAVFALFFLIILVILAVFADLIAKYGPMDTGIGPPLQPPGSQFLMGTDDLARDIFSGVVHGARVSLIVGFTAAFTATLIGVIIGSISGYFGGSTDYLLTKLCELFQSVPRFLFALVIVVFFGNTVWNVVVVIGILSWPRTGRLVRSEFLRLRETEFVMAAQAVGMSSARIIFKHILPNVMHVILVTASLEVGAAIITEAGLSFLGAGDPNLMSWGRMLHNAQAFLRTAWWMAIFPGCGIFFTVLSMNLIGDGLNDALNPRLRRIQRQ
ncbi:MAG: ABC transporter permease [Deltaproteobacteria bacterium]|nr:ABC transporter permease [Deltaproteobacteria bacterium]MBW2308917.1 ABC transporter permease [Deltaproteobacteria bacterium]